RIWQLDIATNTFDIYAPRGQHTLDLVDDAREYLPTVRARLCELAACGPRFDLCLYNAGMDTHATCAVGGLCGITRETLAEREVLVFDWCASHEIPIAFVLAGGYTGVHMTQRALVDLHRLTLQAAATTAHSTLSV
ncbi:MAG: hypothetical protein LC737_10680, partial [Chloroflexi bacterium]|nr:hypothetical protein [Chloroflexota bacterium]